MHDLAYIVRDSSIPYISKDAKHILDHLASREGGKEESWPSTQTLASCTNISLKGVQRAINCLIENGLVTRVSGKLTGTVNHYKVTLPAHYIDEWCARNRKSARRVGRADLPPVGHAVLPGRPSEAAGVGHGGLRIEKPLCEGKETETQDKVSQSVCLSQSPIAQRHTPPPKGGRGTFGNEVIERDEKGVAVVERLANGKFRVDRTYGAFTCWRTGCSNGEAHKFWRYNQARGWPLLADGMSLLDIALRWRDAWMASDPEGYRQERELRAAAGLRKEEERLRAEIEAEERSGSNSSFS